MTTTERTAQIAAEVWTLMLQEADPMPVWAARDYVMDKVGCERSEVLGILVNETCEWGNTNHPEGILDGNTIQRIGIKSWDAAREQLYYLRDYMDRYRNPKHFDWVRVMLTRVDRLEELQRAD